MNLGILKTGFKNYLAAKGGAGQNQEFDEKTEGSLFNYAGNFMEYLDKQIPEDFEKSSKTIDSILDMNSEGRLETSKNSQDAVLKEILGEDLFKKIESLLKNKDENSDLFTEVFNELLKNDKFKNAVDFDKSGDITNEELSKFLNAVKGLDLNDKDVSIKDLLTAAEKIKNGSFDISEPEDNSEDNLTDEDIKDIACDMQDAQPVSCDALPNMSSTNVSNPNERTLKTDDSNSSAKNLGNMTEEELKQELEKAENKLAEKKEALSKILSDENPEIKNLKNAAETAHKTYQEKLKEFNEMSKTQTENLQKKIDDKQKEIDEKNAAITNKESEVSNAQNTYNNAKSNRENLENILNSLKTSDSENKEDTNKQISEVSQQLEAAKKAEAEAQKALETAKKELEQLKKEKTELETGENGLNKLKEEMNTLLAEISKKYPEIQQLEENWKKAEEAYKQGKSAAVSNAKSEVLEAQKGVNKVKTALADFKNNEAQTKYNNQYNEQAGNKLAAAAHSTVGTQGRCLHGVNNTLYKVYGQKINAGSAYMAADILASNSGIGAHFTEVQVSRKDLSRLPKGAVVVWNNNASGGGSNVSRAGKIHGHISISLGDGRESSDHIRKQLVNRDASFRVFYPKS